MGYSKTVGVRDDAADGGIRFRRPVSGDGQFCGPGEHLSVLEVVHGTSSSEGGRPDGDGDGFESV